MKNRQDDRCDDLLTVRDWLRHAVSRFNAARLVYGHGTSTALDEAAFLILATLHLPIDDLAPWLDARLTREERARLAAILDARVETRKPAPYLTNCAYIGGNRFYVDERTIVPRSFIGELLCAEIAGEDMVSPLALDNATPETVLDLCTGGGSLAILAALAFPDAHVDAVDLSADALAVAARNVADYGLDDRITLMRSDLFSAIGSKRYDLIVSNPPYVRDAAVDAFPPEYKAEPRMAHAGGGDGLDLVRRILDAAGRHLAPDGTLVVEIGQEREALEESRPDLPFLWLDTAESSGEVFQLPAAALAATPKRGKPRKGT